MTPEVGEKTCGQVTGVVHSVMPFGFTKCDLLAHHDGPCLLLRDGHAWLYDGETYVAED